MNKIDKGWNKAKLDALLDNSDLAVIKAALTIYDRQTEDEKAIGDTKHHNKVGFSGAHAEFMSRFCLAAKSGEKINPGFMALARRTIKHYHRQLLEVANAKMPEGPKNAKLKELA